MPGRHRARPTRLSYAVVLVALIGVAGGALVVASKDATEGAPDAASRVVDSPDATEEPTAVPASDAPEVVAPEKERKGKLVIHATGDVNLDPSYVPNLRTYGYGYAWSGLDGLFRDDDLTIVNLECAVSNLGTAAAKEFTFRGDPDALPAMRRAGVEVANLGNNHSQDFGKEAMLDSRRNLIRAGIAPVGAGRDEAQAMRPALFEVKGWRIAVLGFGGVYPSVDWFAGPDTPGMANGDSIPDMVRAVKAADRVADLVIVMIHWGVELDTYPRAEDVARAHAMIRAGADMIFGGHAHRLQPMIPYRGRPVFYSLGNFVWPSLSAAGSTTGVAEVVVRPDGSIRARLIPAYIASSGHPVLRES